MNWLVVIGFVALLALVLSCVLIVFVARKGKVEPLPDGDYVVTIVGTRQTPQGAATTFRIDEPKEFKGRTVTMIQEKTE